MRTEVRELARKEFHHLDTIYFNTAYFGPSPYSAKGNVDRALLKELNPSFHEYSSWLGIAERTRELLSKFISCTPDQITHSTSSSDIINILANGLTFKKNDLVVSVNKDYPSNVIPWMLGHEQGRLNFKLLDLESFSVPCVDWLEEKLPKNTSVFTISHVSFDTGKKINLLEIGKFLKSRGIFFIVDCTQSLGGMSISTEELSYIDVLTCSTYKWMLGPYGHAFAYFSNEAIEKVKHHNGNWLVSTNSKSVYSLLDYTTETLPGARKYDRGQNSSMLTMACLEAGLNFLLSIGLETIQEHNEEIRNYFLKHYPKDKFELITPEAS